jgi:hypothetical protein
MYRFRIPLAIMLAAAQSGCAPALDWREFQAEGTGIVATFPCKPDRHSRSVALATQTVRMEMLVCSAGDVTFALSFADLSDPGQVGATLSELQALAASNLGAARADRIDLAVPGMTPSPNAARLRLEAMQANGASLQEQATFFAKGLRVYQATVLGKEVPAEAADTFFAGLRLPS